MKPVTRETSAFVRERGFRPLIATLHGSLLLLRPKGLRREEALPLDAAYSMAVKARVYRELADKRAARKLKKGGG